MRIISGQWRGRPLTAPKGDATRPTGDRTRETLFSMLLSRIGSFEGLSVGDFFAGSGALGFEALSRGAASCLFVEQDKPALDAHFAARKLPRHPLEDQGYPSVGCVPCTSQVQPGEDPRAGRWRGWDKTECGIHDPVF